MRVAICVDAFPKLSETFVLDQVKVLRSAGHDVIILSAGRSGDAVMHPAAAALTPVVRHLPVPPVWRRAAAMMLGPRRGQDDADILHCHFGPVGTSRLYLARRLRVPLVVSFHGYDLIQYPRRHGRHVYRGLFRHAAQVIVNTMFAWDRVTGLGCPADKILRLPLGVDIEAFPFRPRTAPPDSPVVITVARLVEKKGIHVALEAIAEVRRSFPDLRYHVVGDGPWRSRLEAQARSLGIASAVTFFGAQNRADLVRRLDAAHLFALPSIAAPDGDVETQGLVAQEAQACGLPVLVTDTGGLPEGIDVGRSGYVVPQGDPRALATCLIDLLQRADAWPEMGRRGRQWVEARFGLERFGRELIGMYERVLAQRAA